MHYVVREPTHTVIVQTVLSTYKNPEKTGKKDKQPIYSSFELLTESSITFASTSLLKK